MKGKTVCITGATSGIGLACAKILAHQGARLILVGRRHDRLQQIAAGLLGTYGTEIYTIPLDVRQRGEVSRLLGQLPDAWQTVDMLINNAGLAAGSDLFHEASLDDWEQMIDTNVKGLLYVTRALLPAMFRGPAPHIVNIGSIAGKEVYMRGNVYCSTKFAVDALTRALRIDLLDRGVKVSQVAPGAVETEFSLVRYKGDALAAAKVYQGYQPLTSEDVAQAVVWVLSQPDHVNISDLIITPKAQASPGYVHRVQV